MPRRRTTDEKFIFFSTAEECADAAAPIFQARRWRWTGHGVDGIPTRDDIYRTLIDLADGSDYGETGRLIYEKGRFGHERPPATQQQPAAKFSARREGLVPITDERKP